MEQGLELQTVWIVAIAVLSVVVAALLGYVAVLSRRLDNLTKKYEFFMQDSDGKSVETKLREDVSQLKHLNDSLDLLHATQRDVLSVQNQCLRKIGFVKYNAFDNIGNNLSFAFSLLDSNGNGFCLSSVYGRNESRIFAKPIVDGKCLYSMSEEEKESLEHALNYQGHIEDETEDKQKKLKSK